MMVKKRWLLIPVVAGLLALLVTGGAIFAQGNNHPGGGGNVQSLVSRVAEILNLEESDVQSAFNQAIRERQDAHLQARLAEVVDRDRLSQEEADAIMEWYQARPDAAVQLPVAFFRGEPALQRKLDRMVEAGVITEEEAGQVMTWYQSRPEGLPLGAYGRGWRGHGFHGGPMRGGAGTNHTEEFRGVPQSFTSPVNASAIFY